MEPMVGVSGTCLQTHCTFPSRENHNPKRTHRIPDATGRISSDPGGSPEGAPHRGPPNLAACNINETLATLNPIDVSVVRTKLLIHAKKHKYTLHLQDLLIHFQQVFQSEEDVQYFLTVLGDGWFIPKTPGVWRIQHPEWWR